MDERRHQRLEAVGGAGAKASGIIDCTNADKDLLESLNILYTRYKNNSSHFDALLKKKC